MTKKYPKEMFVQYHKDEYGDGFHLCEADPELVEDGEVAVYQLVKVGRKSTDSKIKYNS